MCMHGVVGGVQLSVLLFQAQWLSRLHDAQESYKEACRKSDSKRPSRDCGVDITVQCENESFMESPEEKGILHGSSFKTFNPLRAPPPNSLLGVPRGKEIEVHDAGSPEEGSRNRKIRSSSSDAAAALQQEELDQGAVIRRTSDPICQHTRVNDGELMIVVPQLHERSADQDSLTSINHHGSPSCHELTAFSSPAASGKFEASSTRPRYSGKPTIQRTTSVDVDNAIEPFASTSSSSSRRPFHGSLRIRRKTMMKAIHEKSQSIDTVYIWKGKCTR